MHDGTIASCNIDLMKKRRLSLIFTKVCQTDGGADCRTEKRSRRDTRTHLKMCSIALACGPSPHLSDSYVNRERTFNSTSTLASGHFRFLAEGRWLISCIIPAICFFFCLSNTTQYYQLDSARLSKHALKIETNIPPLTFL